VREQSRSGSDAEKYVQQAYLHSLEGLRLGYYSALAAIIKSRENLGISNDELRRNAEATLYQYAEKVSGRVEIFSNSLREIKARPTKDATNTSLLASANEVSIQRGVEITRLESLLSIMSQLDMDTVLYRSVLLRENKGVSLRMIDIEAGKRMPT
jgi:small conductance mechanosensitive channel